MSFPGIKSNIQIRQIRSRGNLKNPTSAKLNSGENFIAYGIAAGIINMCVFHAIRVRLHPDFNNHAFRHCVIFSGKGSPTSPPPNKSENARAPMSGVKCLVTLTNPQTFNFEFHLRSLPRSVNHPAALRFAASPC